MPIGASLIRNGARSPRKTTSPRISPTIQRIGSRGDPWVALLAVALLGYLTRTGFQHFIVGQRKLLEVLLKARSQVRRLQIIRFLFFPRIARDE